MFIEQIHRNVYLGSSFIYIFSLNVLNHSQETPNRQCLLSLDFKQRMFRTSVIYMYNFAKVTSNVLCQTEMPIMLSGIMIILI